MLGNVLFEQCVRGIVFDECVNVDSSNHHFEGYVHDQFFNQFIPGTIVVSPNPNLYLESLVLKWTPIAIVRLHEVFATTALY